MKLNLKRPLVFFDLETTGVSTTADKIVEICAIKLNPDGTRQSFVKRLNPGKPIPATATKVHHISNEDVADAPRFAEIADEVLAFLEDSDLAGFNSNKFDIPLLIEEFKRAGKKFDIASRKLVDVQTIFHKMEQRTLVAAYRLYCNKELTDAHSAMGDTEATIEVLESQLDRYPELKNDVDSLAEFCNDKKALDLHARIVMNSNGIPTFNFGRHKGKPVSEVFSIDKGYFNWMMNGDFAPDTKKVLRELHDEYFPNSK